MRLLCLHQCVEGATVGPGNFTFRGADDVIRGADLPAGYHAVQTSLTQLADTLPQAEGDGKNKGGREGNEDEE